MTRVRAFALIVVLASAPLAAQRTWIVQQGGGSGVDFTDIPPAIAAATTGDRIEVRLAATYSSFVLSKGLDIEAVAGAVVANFDVRDTAATDAARVAGFTLTPPPDTVGATISNCSGPVTLASTTVANAGNYSMIAKSALAIARSPRVLVLDCQLTGQSGPSLVVSTFSFSTPGGAGIYADNSGLVVQRSQLRGGTGGVSAAWGGAGGAGLLARDASIRLSEVDATGGDGGWGRFIGGTGGDGVQSSIGVNSVLITTSRLAAGAGGSSNATPGWPGSAIFGTGAVAQDVMLSGAIGGGATIIPTPPTILTSGLGTVGGTATLTLTGPPGISMLLAADTRHDHFAYGNFLGPFLLTTAFIPITTATISSAGSTALPLPVPSNPWLRNQTVFFQGAALTNPPSFTALGDLLLQ